MKINDLRIWLISKLAVWCGVEIYFKQILEVIEVKKVFIDRTGLECLKIEREFYEDELEHRQFKTDIVEEFCHLAGDKFAEWLLANPDTILKYEELRSPGRYNNRISLIAKFWLPIEGMREKINWASAPEKRGWRYAPMAGQKFRQELVETIPGEYIPVREKNQPNFRK